jgi:hypothetical protein
VALEADVASRLATHEQNPPALAAASGRGGAGERHPGQYLGGMPSRGSTDVYDRVLERRQGVALAWHFREAEGLSIGQIAERLGRTPATAKAYFYDPTGEKAPAVKVRDQGVCRGCGAYTQPRSAKGDAYA